MQIVSNQRLEAELIVPSDWLTWLKSDVRFDFAVDELGRNFEAAVMRVGRVVDPISQTVKVYARVDDAAGVLRSGMSGTAQFRERR